MVSFVPRGGLNGTAADISQKPADLLRAACAPGALLTSLQLSPLPAEACRLRIPEIHAEGSFSR